MTDWTKFDTNTILYSFIVGSPKYSNQANKGSSNGDEGMLRVCSEPSVTFIESVWYLPGGWWI